MEGFRGAQIQPKRTIDTRSIVILHYRADNSWVGTGRMLLVLPMQPERYPMKTKFGFRAAILAVALILPLYPQGAPTVTTDVLVMLTIKPGIERQQVMAVMQDEVRDTVRLYLAGKIRQWYSRSDGRGVIFILSSKDVAEAKTVMESLPLSKANLADLEYTPMSPLAPLGLLLGAPAGNR